LSQGTWVVAAKTSIEVPISSGTIVDCRTVAGSRVDRTSMFPQPLPFSGGPEVTVFALAARFTDMSGGDLHVDCRVEHNTGDAKARFLKITAVRAGRLTIRNLATGSVSTFGAAGTVPQFIEGFRTADVAAGAGVFATVAGMPLPTGRWSVMAKFNVHTDFTGSIGDLRSATCRLVAPGQSDSSSTRLSLPNFSLDRLSFALDVAPVVGSSGGHARLQCKGSGNAGDVKVSDIRLQAMGVGHLVRRNLGTGGTLTFGSGIPRVLFGFDAGPLDVPHTMANLRTMHLAQGAWSVRATASAIDADGTPMVVTCELGMEGDFDRAQATTFGGTSAANHAPLTMLTVHRFMASSGGDAVLRCGFEAPVTTDGSAKLVNIRLVAVRAGTLTNGPLT
jgi:hypothetical protein